MVQCKFFQQGSCKFGNNCRFEHTARQDPRQQGFIKPGHFGNSPPNNAFGGGDGGGGGGHPNRAFGGGDAGGGGGHSNRVYKPNQQVQADQTPTLNQVLETIAVEMDIWEKSHTWPFSCFGYTKYVKSLPALEDYSMEEVRYKAYDARAVGKFDSYTTWVSQLASVYNVKRQQLKAPSGAVRQQLIQVIKEINSMPSSETSSSNQPGKKLFGGSTTAASFGSANQAAPAASAQPSGVFGASAVFGSRPGTQSVFGGGGGGGTTAKTGPTAQSVFGGGSPGGAATQSVFGGGSPGGAGGPSVFGGSSQGGGTGQAIFGGSPPGGAPAPSLFGAGPPGGAVQSPQSIFGAKPLAGAANPSSVCGGSTVGGAPATSVFGGAAPGGQSVFGGTTTGGAANAQSIFGAGPASNSGVTTSSAFGSSPAGGQSPFKSASLTGGASVFGGVAGTQANPGGAFGSGVPANTAAQSSTGLLPTPSSGFGGNRSAFAGTGTTAFPASTAAQGAVVSNSPMNKGFGQSPAGGAVAAPSATSGQQASTGLYTPKDQLSKEEIAEFEADRFTLGKIPTRPPPIELI